jgi:hypothetical protein
MRIKLSQLVAAGLVSGFLVLGGVTLAASAQETPETTETTPSTVAPEAPAQTPSEDTAPTAPDPSAEDPNCPNMGGDSGTGTATGLHARGPHGGPRSQTTTPSVDASAV